MKKLIALTILFSSVSAFACGSSVCTGDRVNFQNNVGTVVEVFNNGTVKINVDGHIGYEYKSANRLGKGVPCYKGVCANNRVNFSSYAGTVKEVFDNGNVKIDVDGHIRYEYKKVNKIGVGYRCSDKLCEGDRVNYGRHTGTVKEIFNNGNVKINTDGIVGYEYKNVRKLGYNLECYN